MYKDGLLIVPVGFEPIEKYQKPKEKKEQKTLDEYTNIY
jgi:hypothetical protein